MAEIIAALPPPIENTPVSPLLTVLEIVCVVSVYFVPCIVAAHYQSKHLPFIFALNLFLGWTGIGWLVALAKSLPKIDPADEVFLTTPSRQIFQALIALQRLTSSH